MVIPNRFKVTTQDAYNYAASKFFSDQQLCIVLKLGGKLDKNTLDKAIRSSIDFEPVLGCKLMENDNSPYWERRNDLGQIACAVVETTSSEEALEVFINQPIHADVDPLMSTRIFREEKSDVLCVKINHSACDAGGLKEYIALLSNIYTMLIRGKQIIAEPNLGRRDQSQVFQSTKDLKSLDMKGFPTPTWVFPQKEGNERLHAFRTITKGQFKAIKVYAKSKGATINDLLLATLYRTFFVLNNTAEDKHMIHQVSIDLRRYCPNHKAEAVCNLSGALYIALERKIGEKFEQTLGRVTASLNKIKTDYPGLESAAGLEYLFRQGYVGLEKYLAESAAIGKQHNVTFPLLSNFGVLHDNRFGELSVKKGYISSPIMYQPGFMLGATTFNDEMTLSVGYCGQENQKAVKDFLDGYVSELPAQITNMSI